MSTFDPHDGSDYAATMAKARTLTGRVCSELEEQEAIDRFLAWGEDMGLKTSLVRMVDGEGMLVWWMRIDTGRGEVTKEIYDPREWEEGLKGLGLR